MHLEFLVEEQSVEAALEILVPQIVGPQTTFKIHPFSGKADLLAKLPERLKGYASWLPSDWKIVVLVDEDRDHRGCEVLKSQLESAAVAAGLATRSRADAHGQIQVVNRIAVEELEAWFLGDPDAIVAAYPKVQPQFAKKERYRDPDRIKGGTWEAFERLLQQKGYYPEGLPKIEAARRIAAHMDPQRNRSRSFQTFRDAVMSLLPPQVPSEIDAEE